MSMSLPSDMETGHTALESQQYRCSDNLHSSVPDFWLLWALFLVPNTVRLEVLGAVNFDTVD